MVKISIIMPVYNCEAYLQESIESVLCQTLCEWELLCVDDGSMDNSLEILRKYQSKDSRIHVFTQPNQGAGVARNLGIQHAQGEYIAFLDADDYYLNADALEKMYEACCEYNVAVCGSNIRLLRNGVIAEDGALKEVRLAAKTNHILHYKDFQFDYGYYGFLFSTGLIRKNKILFSAYRRFEDPPFLTRMMLAAEKFCFVETALYCYRTPNVTARFNAENTRDLVRGLLDNLEFAASNNLNILFERTLKRLEVEYSNIICHNLSTNSIEILELLLKANQLVRRVMQKDDYVIAPLQKILGSVAEAENYHKGKLLRKMSDCGQIYLYGAGKATADFLIYLQDQGLREKVKAIIVTSKEGNPETIDNVPIIAVADYLSKNGDLILITVTSIYREEIVQRLQKLMIYDYEFVDASMLI